MPEFLVTSPDGKQYRVRGPDGATQQDALRQVQQKLGTGGGADADTIAPTRTENAAGVQGPRGTPSGRAPLRPSDYDPATGMPFEQEAEVLPSIARGYSDWRSRISAAQTEKINKGEGLGDYIMMGPGEVGASRLAAPARAALPAKPAPMGRAARATGALRSEAAAGAGKTAQEETAAAATQARKGQAVERAQAQLGRAPAVAEQRAQRAAPAVPMEAERQRVLADLRRRPRGLQGSYQEAALRADRPPHRVGLAARRGPRHDRPAGAR